MPHLNKAHAARGRGRQAGARPGDGAGGAVDVRPAAGLPYAAQITRALNYAWIPCPSAADPRRNPHRTGSRWTLRTVSAILTNPRYTGRQVWNRQRTDFDLVDPANTGLGHRQVQRWNLPEGWVISKQPALALISEAISSPPRHCHAAWPVFRPPAGIFAGWFAGVRRCGRKLESFGPMASPAYRCRHGYTAPPALIPRPKNTYVREDRSSRTWPPCHLMRLPARRVQYQAEPRRTTRAGRRPDRQPAHRGRHPHLRPRPADPALQRRHRCDHRERPLPYTEHIPQKGGQKRERHPLRPEAGPG